MSSLTFTYFPRSIDYVADDVYGMFDHYNIREIGGCEIEVNNGYTFFIKHLVPNVIYRNGDPILKFFEGMEYDTVKFEQFIIDIKNNKKCIYVFDFCNGFDGFKYENGTFTITKTDYKGQKYIEIDVSDKINELCDQLYEFDLWANSLL